MVGLILLGALIGAETKPGPLFHAHSAGADVRQGSIQTIGKDWTVDWSDVGVDPTPGGDLLALRRTGLALPPFPVVAQVVLANGDRIPGQPLSVENDQLHFRAMLADASYRDQAYQNLQIPLAAIAEIWFQPQADRRLPKVTSGERRPRDVVYLTNGDRRIGTVVSSKAGTPPLMLKEDARETQIDALRIVAVRMNTDLAKTLRPKGPYGRLVLTNGCRISLLNVESEGRTLKGQTLFGNSVTIGIDQLAGLDIHQGKATFLSDLKPLRYDFTPFLGVRWNYELDHSVAGGDLRLVGQTYDKGIGMHSQSKLVFSLKGQYRRFDATVGLDDLTGQGGSAAIRVLVDGTEKMAHAKDLTALNGPLNIRIDVTGAKELALVVEFGAGGDVCDHVDWADARLVK